MEVVVSTLRNHNSELERTMWYHSGCAPSGDWICGKVREGCVWMHLGIVKRYASTSWKWSFHLHKNLNSPCDAAWLHTLGKLDLCWNAKVGRLNARQYMWGKHTKVIEVVVFISKKKQVWAWTNFVFSLIRDRTFLQTRGWLTLEKMILP